MDKVEIYQDYYDSMISELEFIASIPKDAKPCFESHTVLSAQSWVVTPVARSLWYGEGRKTGLNHVLSVLGMAGLYYLTCEDVERLEKLASLLHESMKGLSNIRSTYKNDPIIYQGYDHLVCYTVQLLMYNINSKLKLMGRSLNKLAT